MKTTDFSSKLQGPPETETLLNCLVGVLLGVTRRKATEGPIRKGISTLPDGNGEAGVISSLRSVNPSSEDDSFAQEVYLNDLCSYLSSGTSSRETGETPGASPPIPLPLPKIGSFQKARSLFTRLAKSHYWRRRFLIPLLRRWWREEGHSVFGFLLLQSITDAVARELVCIQSDSGEAVMGNEGQETCHDDGMGNNKKLLWPGAMQDLEELLKSTGSFRGLCIGVDAIIRNNLSNLLQCVRKLLAEGACKDEKDALTGSARAEMEGLVNGSTKSVLEDLSAFFFGTMNDVEKAFRESVWTFLMALLSAYTGALILLRRDTNSDTQDNLFFLEAQRMFIGKMQEHLQGYLTVRLSSDSVAMGNSPVTVHNVVCRQSFFWRASMEVEIAMESLPPAFISNSLVVSWARKLVAAAWGNAFCLVQSLVRAQEATEEVVGTVETTDSIISAIRRRHRELSEEHLERLVSAELRCFSGTKRPRMLETDAVGDKTKGGSRTVPTAEETPAFGFSSYATEYFLRTYHPSCFAVLSLVEQDTLVLLLRQLYAVIVNKEREAIRRSLLTVIVPDGSNVTDTQKSLLHWHLHHVHTQVVQALGEDALLLMCLLHAVFIFLERIGKTNLNVCDVLSDTLLPILAMLCSERHGGFAEHEDGEQYYEIQQCIMMLLASGFLELPWCLRGIRIRQVLYNYIWANLRDSFSAEEGLTEVSHIFVQYADVLNPAEDAAAALCGDLSDDPFLRMLASEGEAAATTMEVMDDLLRLETPVHFPAPCGALLLISIFRTLSLNFSRLFAEWEQQKQHVREGAMDYLGREATFCTIRDIGVFRVLIQLAHRMVLGFQLQPVGLLRLWLSFLTHLFTHFVPHWTEDDEIVLMTLHTKDGSRSRAEEEPPRRAYKRSPNETSQGELRAILGELLADLALMPLVDAEAVMQCPVAVPHRPGSAQWIQKQSERSQDALILQRVLPVLVLEELCFALRIPIEDLDEREADPAFVRQVGKTVEQSFLGVLGVFAFCQRMELFVVPGTFTDKRFAELLQTLWLAVEAGSMVMAPT
ncbi:hypothetical protein BCY84_15303 [Trypanosoma cruzi cruzi]|nr:hypothetical protein BCY84_15303 [Trypanosoma cruzi cruzi]